ncbi:MAG: DUF4124 domain-containing protein [Gammaproteobacteria bacterium]
MKKLIPVIFLVFITMPSAAQVYKWVDENGKTHYSQTPPPVEQKTSRVQKMQRTGALLKITPEKNGHNYYCGNLLLLSDRGGDDILYENIKLSLRDWEIERNKQQVYIKSLKEPGKPWDYKKINNEEEKLAKYSCRVVWGYEKLKEFESFGYRARKTNEELKKQYEAIKAAQDKECPADAKRFGSVLVGDAARSWYECPQGYEREMKKIRNKISENRKSMRETGK